MTSKNIVVFGGTGETGLLFCNKALEAGHSLTLYARNPSKFSWELASHAKVKVIKGELTNDEGIASAVQNQDVVISFLGPTTLLSKTPPTVYTDAYGKIFAAMRKYDVKRIIAIGTPYMKDEKDPGGLKVGIAKTFMKTVAAGVYAAFQAIGELFDQEKELEWTIVRIARLVDKKVKVRVGYVGEPGWSQITSREGTAAWMVELLDNEEYIREKPCLSS